MASHARTEALRFSFEFFKGAFVVGETVLHNISIQHIEHLLLEIEGSDSDFVGEIVGSLTFPR